MITPDGGWHCDALKIPEYAGQVPPIAETLQTDGFPQMAGASRHRGSNIHIEVFPALPRQIEDVTINAKVPLS